MNQPVVLVVPQELLSRIFTLQVDALSRDGRNAALVTLALVSRQFLRASYDVLYGDLQVDWYAGLASQLARTLVHDPQLASRVRAFAAHGVSYDDWALSHAELILSGTADVDSIVIEARGRALAGERAPQVSFLDDVAFPEFDLLDEPSRNIALSILEEFCQAAWLEEGHDDWCEGPPTGDEPARAIFFVLSLLPALRELTLTKTSICAHDLVVPREAVRKLRRLTSFHACHFDDCLMTMLHDLGRVKSLTFSLRQTFVNIEEYPRIRLPSLIELTIHSRVPKFPDSLARWLAVVAPPTLRKLTITEVLPEYLRAWVAFLQTLPDLDYLHIDLLMDSRYGAYPAEFLSWLASSHVRILRLGFDPSRALMLSIPNTVVNLAVRPDRLVNALISFYYNRHLPIRDWLCLHPRLETFEITCSRHNLTLEDCETLLLDIGPTFEEAGVRLSVIKVQDEWSDGWECTDTCSWGCDPSRDDCVSAWSDSDGSGSDGSTIKAR